MKDEEIIETIEWVPTEEEKEEIMLKCNYIIENILELEKPEKMAFCLIMLMKSFEESYNLKLSAIISNENNKS